jgi:predicted house-cleaning noncanonical NTP pyrophosphatase (MazG superfamily)
MRKFTFYILEEENIKVDLWNHYGGSTDEYLAAHTFETTNDVVSYIETTLDHYNYNKEFQLKLRGKKYSCPSRNTIYDVLTY